MESQQIVPERELHQFVVRAMMKVGTKKDHAESLANLIVAADARGHYSHGLNRIDYYLSDVAAGNTRADTEPEILKETPATAHVDGNDCLGPVVGTFCMDLAMKKAKEVGIGWVCAKGSNHFGIAGWYSLRAMNKGLLGMAFTNTSPQMVPTRSKNKVLGTNPISLAASGQNGDRFVLDMATTVAAVGKIELKQRLGQTLPSGWGVDRNGKASKDLDEVFYNGGLNPLGGLEETCGYKGYGLAMMVEIFCGILSGSKFGRAIDPSGVSNLGQCFIAVDPTVFAAGFQERMSALIHQCKMSQSAGEQEVLVPGDPENFHEELCARLGGIPYPQKQLDFADEIAKKYGVGLLKRL